MGCKSTKTKEANESERGCDEVKDSSSSNGGGGCSPSSPSQGRTSSTGSGNTSVHVQPFSLKVLHEPATVAAIAQQTRRERLFRKIEAGTATSPTTPTTPVLVQGVGDLAVHQQLNLLRFHCSKKLLGKGGSASVFVGTVSLPPAAPPTHPSAAATTNTGSSAVVPEASSPASSPAGSPAVPSVLGLVAVKEVKVEGGGTMIGTKLDEDAMLSTLKKEHDALGQLIESPHIVQVYHFQSLPGRARIYMELVPRGTLRGHLSSRYEAVMAKVREGSGACAGDPNTCAGGLPVHEKRFHELEARSYVRQALMGLVYLHSKGVLHRDMKPENMLLVHSFHWDQFRKAALYRRELGNTSGGNKIDDRGANTPLPLPQPLRLGGESEVMLKLSDFGTAKTTVLGGICATTANVVGTVPYMSPESISGKYSEGSDIWAIGVSFLELCSHGSAALLWAEQFGKENVEDSFGLLLKIGSLNEGKHMPGPFPSHLSSAGQEMLQQCFNFKAQERPSAVALLESAYFRDAMPAESLLKQMEPLVQYPR